LSSGSLRDDLLGTLEVLQPVLAEGAQLDAGRQGVSDELGNRMGEHDLPAVGNCLEP
jgi:hypothetical protein